jgi:hypothetical protein
MKPADALQREAPAEFGEAADPAGRSQTRQQAVDRHTAHLADGSALKHAQDGGA